MYTLFTLLWNERKSYSVFSIHKQTYHIEIYFKVLLKIDMNSLDLLNRLIIELK